MDPVDTLPVIAEMALGLVGFTAIVAALRRPGAGLVGADLVRSIHLLVYSSVTILLALLPYFLIAIDLEPATTWRLSSAAMMSCSLVGFATNPRPRFWRSVGSLSVDWAILIAINVFAALNVGLQIANVAGAFAPPHFWPFLLGLIWYLVFCLTQFAGLLFLRPGE